MLHGLVTDPAVVVTAVFVISFLAPVLFLVRIRNAERRRREPWGAIFTAFLWGAVGAVLLAFTLNSLLDADARIPDALYGLPVLAVIVAPLVEETVKPLGLAFIRDRDPEGHDGLIYGAAAGLGFAFSENLYYAGVVFALGGQEAALFTAVFRAIAAVSLHGAATALTGYGLWKLRYRHNPFPLLLFLPSAVLLHAAYNALASVALVWGALGALLLAVGVYRRILARVRVHGS